MKFRILHFRVRGGDDGRLQCCHSRESGNPVSVLNVSGFPIGSGMTGNIQPPQMAEGLHLRNRSGVTLIGIIAAIVIMGLLGAGVLMVTHNEEAAGRADRVLRMAGGRLELLK